MLVVWQRLLQMVVVVEAETFQRLLVGWLEEVDSPEAVDSMLQTFQQVSPLVSLCVGTRSHCQETTNRLKTSDGRLSRLLVDSTLELRL